LAQRMPARRLLASSDSRQLSPMPEFSFDPPLTLKGDVVIRNLDDAVRFMIGYRSKAAKYRASRGGDLWLPKALRTKSKSIGLVSRDCSSCPIELCLGDVRPCLAENSSGHGSDWVPLDRRPLGPITGRKERFRSFGGPVPFVSFNPLFQAPGPLCPAGQVAVHLTAIIMRLNAEGPRGLGRAFGTAPEEWRGRKLVRSSA
jgi:hypothetical protein